MAKGRKNKKRYGVRRVFTYDCGHIGKSYTAKICRACYEHNRFLKSEHEEGFSYRRPDGYRAYRRKRKQLLEHRVIAERVLGRPLKTTEHVHHLNLVRTDNRHRNLVICDIRYHKWLHNEMARRYAKEHGLGRELPDESKDAA